MNDRQRTILGLVAVFSLTGIAVLSLALIDKATRGGLTIAASEQVSISTQTVSNSATDDIDLSLNGSTITLKALAPLPSPKIILELTGVESPSVENRMVNFKESAGVFSGSINLGAMAKGQTVDIVVKSTLRGSSRIEVSASADGFAATNTVRGATEN